MEHPPKRTKLTHEASIYGDRVDLTSDGSDKEEQGSKISLGKLPVAQVACNNGTSLLLSSPAHNN